MVKKLIPITMCLMLYTGFIQGCRWLSLEFENNTNKSVNFSIDKGSVVCVDNCGDPVNTTSTALLRNDTKTCRASSTYPYSSVSLSPNATKTYFVYAFCGPTCFDADSTFNGTFTDSNNTKLGSLNALQKVHHDWAVTGKSVDNGPDVFTFSTSECTNDSDTACAKIIITSR